MRNLTPEETFGDIGLYSRRGEYIIYEKTIIKDSIKAFLYASLRYT